MGKVNFTNIVVGEGKMFCGPGSNAGVLLVDTNITSNGDDSIYYVGSTQEGVAIGWEPDMVDIEVDQFGDAARVIQSKVKVTIKTTLAEATLQVLALAWGYSRGASWGDKTVTGYSTPGGGLLQTGYIGGTFSHPEATGTGAVIGLGIHSTYPEERYVRIEGTAPGSSATTTVYRTYRNPRCVQYSSSEHSLQRSDNVKFSVEFRALPDGLFTGREYGFIKDSTFVPYSNYQ